MELSFGPNYTNVLYTLTEQAFRYNDEIRFWYLPGCLVYSLIKHISFLELFLFACIPLIDGPEIAHYPRVHFTSSFIPFGFADGTTIFFPTEAEMPDIKIVMLTTSDDDQDLFDAYKHGASGYLLKNINGQELVDMLCDVEKIAYAARLSAAYRLIE